MNQYEIYEATKDLQSTGSIDNPPVFGLTFAKTGDHLRVGVQTKMLTEDKELKEGEEAPAPAEYSDENRFNVKNLLEEGSAPIFNLPVLSEALNGMVKDEVKEVILTEHNVTIKLRVHRICEKIKLETEEATNEVG